MVGINITNTDEIQQGVDKVTIDKKGAYAYSRYGLGLFIVILAMFFLPSLVISGLSTFIAAEILEKYSMGISYVCIYLIGFPLMLLIMRKVPKIKATNWTPKKLKVWQVIGLYGFGFTMMNLVAILVSIIEGIFKTNATFTTEDLVNSNQSAVLVFLMGVVVAPIMEEVLFRKIGYERVAAYGGGLYMVWTAILFGLMHGNLGQSIYAGLLGLLFAKITYETGTAKYTMIIHVLINLTGGVGIGSIILRSGSAMLLTIWSFVILAIYVIGILSAVIFLIKYRSALKTAPSITPMTNKKLAFLNVGTILFIALTLGVIIVGIIASL